MANTTVKGCYPNGANSVIVEMSDGSMFSITGLGCGDSAGEVWFAPDGWHYPEPPEKGRRSQGPFTCHTPVDQR